MYRSAVLVALVPPGVVTVMSTVPAESAGAVAVMLVGLLIVRLVAAVDPNLTAVAPRAAAATWRPRDGGVEQAGGGGGGDPVSLPWEG